MINTPEKYQRGGEYYNRLEAQFGTVWADAAAQAAATGDNVELNSVLASARGDGGVRDASTASNLAKQLYNDPFAAPIEQASKILDGAGKAIGDAVKKASGNFGLWIVGGIILVGLFLYFGGTNYVRRKVSGI